MYCGKPELCMLALWCLAVLVSCICVCGWRRRQGECCCVGWGRRDGRRVWGSGMVWGRGGERESDGSWRAGRAGVCEALHACLQDL